MSTNTIRPALPQGFQDELRTGAKSVELRNRLTQVEALTRQILNETFTNAGILGDTGECSICYDRMVREEGLGEIVDRLQDRTPLFGGLTRTNCNHLFHARCLEHWLLLRNTCPMCETDDPMGNQAIQPPEKVNELQPEQNEIEAPQAAPVQEIQAERPEGIRAPLIRAFIGILLISLVAAHFILGYGHLSSWREQRAGALSGRDDNTYRDSWANCVDKIEQDWEENSTLNTPNIIFDPRTFKLNLEKTLVIQKIDCIAEVDGVYQKHYKGLSEYLYTYHQPQPMEELDMSFRMGLTLGATLSFYILEIIKYSIGRQDIERLLATPSWLIIGLIFTFQLLAIGISHASAHQS